MESTSKLTNKMHLFLARDCTRVSSQKLDENERIDVMSIPFEEAIDWVIQGKINANSTAHALLKVERMK